MADIRQHYNTAEWIEYGDGAGTYTPTYASSTSFTIDGVNVTAIYHASRRVKVIASTPGTIYGTISSTSFSTNTTVNVTWDSGSLSSEAITSVYIGALAKTNNSIPTGIIGTTNLADDAVTAAKMAANSVDSDSYVDGSIDLAHMSVNSIDSDQYVDASIDAEHLSADIITAAKIADDAIDSEHYTDGSIDTAHIAADQITNAKIADDQIDSEHYVDASIDLAHLAADSVNGAKIVDDAIDSEHYTDGSIDTAHLGDVQVTLAKLAASSVNSSKIVDDSIVNADINSSAAIDATKIADGTVTTAEFQYINTLSSNAQTQIDAKAATTYVDNAVAGLRTRIIAECASTANVTISSALEAGDAIDGITLVAGDRVLLKDQSTASENGLYTAVGSGAGAASRDTQFNSIAELSGQMVVVNQGSANDNKIFLCTTNNTASLGSDSITFTVITPSNTGTVTSVTAGTGLSGGAITAAGTIAIDSTVATLAGTQTLTNKTLTSPKIGTSILDTNGNELALLTATGSAVNEFTLANAASGNGPTLSSTGETNVDININPKGTGNVVTSNNVTLANDKKVIFGDAGEHIAGDGTNLTVTSSANLNLIGATVLFTSTGDAFNFKDSGGTRGQIKLTGDDFIFKNSSADKDIILQGVTGGSQFDAVTIDMSAAGAATFNDKVIAEGGQLTTTGKALVMGF
jgi:hypothetical protein